MDGNIRGAERFEVYVKYCEHKLGKVRPYLTLDGGAFGVSVSHRVIDGPAVSFIDILKGGKEMSFDEFKEFIDKLYEGQFMSGKN